MGHFGRTASDGCERGEPGPARPAGGGGRRHVRPRLEPPRPDARGAGRLQLVREPRPAPPPPSPLGALGPGEWSLANAFGFTWVDGWSGLTTTAIAGLGGALALLVVFWRPAREESAG